MKIQFGCGSNRIEGWHNVDSEVDITQPLPFESERAEMILAEHVCEHVNCAHCLKFFDECFRILRPGGVIRICVPILERITDRAHRRDLILGHGHQNLFTSQSLVQMLECAGFIRAHDTPRKPCDGHYAVIGMSKDDMETLRIEAIKP